MADFMAVKSPSKIEDIHTLISRTANDNYSACDDTETNFTVSSYMKSKDKYYTANIAVLLLGIGSFFTFMIVISSPDYVEVVYPSHENLLYFVVSIYNTSKMIGLIIMLSPLGSYFSITSRIQYGYGFSALLTIFIPIIPYICDEKDIGMYLFVLFSGILSGLSSAVCIVSLFSFSAMLPPTYLITVVSGQAFSGILSALIRIINKAPFNTNHSGTVISGIGCFAMGSLIYLLGLFYFLCALKTSFVQQFMIRYDAARDAKFLFKLNNNIRSNNNNDTKSNLFSTSIWNKFDRNNADHSNGPFHADFNDGPSSATTGTLTTFNDNDEMQRDKEIEMSIATATTITIATDHTGTMDESHQQLLQRMNNYKNKRSVNILSILSNTEYIDVVNKIYKCLISIFIGYTATYLVYPSMLVDLNLNDEYLMNKKWSGVFLILLWSVCGWIGIQLFAKRYSMKTNYDNLWILQLIWTIIMYPLFLIANADWTDSDVFVYILVAITPFMYGFLAARTYAELPKRIDNENTLQTETAQAIIQIALMIGILIGSWIAYGVSFKL